jgi:fumarate hydratase class II
MTEAGFRIEHDSMGDVRVPAEALWKAQTQRAVENFPVSGMRVDPWLLGALARVKGAAARVNAARGIVDDEVAVAIAAAAGDVVSGAHADQFPIDVFQTGSGTSTNMNMNEVLASLASERLGRPVHPNDEVNASQSSNDTFPTAIHVAAAVGVVRELLPALAHLATTLRRRSDDVADVVKAGRTHLMDATPVTLGQELAGYASAVEHGQDRLRATLPRLCELPLGGTAVGTGINCPPGWAADVIGLLAAELELPLVEAADHFEAQSARDAIVELSGQMRTVAVSLYKIANDLRWMGSGPAAGLAEIHLPDLQPGSSIMPGKVNPVIPEAVCQVVAQVVGNDATIAFGGSAGTFELNVMLPVIGRNMLESVRILATVSRLLADRCIAGIEPDIERCRRMAESSPAIATALNPLLGYETVADIVKDSLRSGRTIREVVLERGLVDAATLERVLDVDRMTRPTGPDVS